MFKFEASSEFRTVSKKEMAIGVKEIAKEIGNSAIIRTIDTPEVSVIYMKSKDGSIEVGFMIEGNNGCTLSLEMEAEDSNVITATEVMWNTYFKNEDVFIESVRRLG